MAVVRLRSTSAVVTSVAAGAFCVIDLVTDSRSVQPVQLTLVIVAVLGLVGLTIGYLVGRRATNAG